VDPWQAIPDIVKAVHDMKMELVRNRHGVATCCAVWHSVATWERQLAARVARTCGVSPFVMLIFISAGLLSLPWVVPFAVIYLLCVQTPTVVKNSVQVAVPKKSPPCPRPPLPCHAHPRPSACPPARPPGAAHAHTRSPTRGREAVE
jgi:hypothetical protein